MIKKEKKGQEEIVGFVLIIIIVTVIALVFLSFSIKKTDTGYESRETESFIGSLMKHTTRCLISGGFENIEDLIRNCYQGKSCSNNLDACEELNSTLSELLENSWPIENTKYSYYSFSSYYTGYGQNISIIAISKGNCAGRKLGAEHLTQNINSRFEVCVKESYSK